METLSHAFPFRGNVAVYSLMLTDEIAALIHHFSFSCSTTLSSVPSGRLSSPKQSTPRRGM